jgi:hypothetical protein
LGQNLGRHVDGYHTVLPDGTVAGHLYYAPSERALIPYDVEPGAMVLYCEWIRPRFQGAGLGRRQFATFLDGARASDAKGVLVECRAPDPADAAALYRRRGFKTVLKEEDADVLYLPITQSEIRVTAEHPRLRLRHGRPVQIEILSGYRCPVDVATQLQLRQVAQEFGDQVILRDVSLGPATLAEFGSVAGVFINGRRALLGGETEEAIRQAIQEAF